MPRIRRAFTLIELLVVIAIIVTLMAILLPAIQKVRSAAQKATCSNNLKQLGIALHNYHFNLDRLPYSKRTAQPQRSWVPDLLPFLEQAAVVSDINYNQNENWWRSTTYAGEPIPNAITVQRHLKVLICPSNPNPERTQHKTEIAPEQDKIGACGDYFIPEGVHKAINGELPAAEQFAATADLRGMMRAYPEKTTFESCKDGVSNTIMVGECAGREDVWRGRVMTPAAADKASPNCARARGGAWATNDNPYEIGQRTEWCSGKATIPGPMRINNSNEWGHLYYSFHQGGAVFCFGDGSVRYLGEETPLWTLADLTTRSGRENVLVPD